MRYFLSILIIFNIYYANECPGDTNLDDTINIQDVILIVNHILDIDSLEDEGLDNADVNNDGGVNVIDVVTVTVLILDNLNQCENSIIIDLSLEWE